MDIFYLQKKKSLSFKCKAANYKHKRTKLLITTLAAPLKLDRWIFYYFTKMKNKFSNPFQRNNGTRLKCSMVKSHQKLQVKTIFFLCVVMCRLFLGYLYISFDRTTNNWSKENIIVGIYETYSHLKKILEDTTNLATKTKLNCRLRMASVV